MINKISTDVATVAAKLQQQIEEKNATTKLTQIENNRVDIETAIDRSVSTYVRSATIEKSTGEQSGIFSSDITDVSDMGHVFNSSNIYNRKDIQWYTRFNKYGCLDPFNAVTNTKEYLFFTKPDLHICTPGTLTLNPQLSNQDYFVELINRYPDVILQLQRSITYGGGTHYPFMNLLSNSVKNTLDLPEISADDIDTSATMYGTSISYRGNGWSSDENFDFSLEFEDTRYLELYNLFRAWEEYEKLKSVGIVSPPNINGAPEDSNGLSYNSYIENKELHDQIGIYKFIMDEDYETILYYAYMIAYPKTVPREAFSELQLGNGLRYTVQFHGQFIEDMKPRILLQFNNLVSETSALSNSVGVFMNSYNIETHSVNGDWAIAPWVVKSKKSNAQQWLGPNSMAYDYKLKWRTQ